MNIKTTLTHRRILLDEAMRFVGKHHRHSPPLKRHVFSIAAHNVSQYSLGERGTVKRQEPDIGVATVDRCSSHAWSQRRECIEIRRLCTIGDNRNVASYLIGQCVKAAWAMGYKRVVTYTRPWENGVSLKAAGFRIHKTAQMVVTYQEDIEGGVVTWVKDYGQEPTPAARKETKRMLDGINATHAEWTDKYQEKTG